MVVGIGFMVLATGICVYFDAKSIGLGRVEAGKTRDWNDLPPLGWAIACVLLWIAAFPLYLMHRHRYVSSKAEIRSERAFNAAALEKLAALRDKGAISEEEFQQQKQDILGQ